MSTKIMLRRDQLLACQTNNPILANGEAMYITDTGKMKIGNNTDQFTDLRYFLPADDDEFHHELEISTDNEDVDEILIWDNSENEYRRISRADFLRSDGVNIIETISEATLFTIASDNYLIYIPAVESFYRFETAGAGYTIDNKYILATGNGGDTSWLACGGQYSINNIDLSAGNSIYINGTRVLTERQPAVADIPPLTSPVTGSGATGTTFSGTECSTLRSEVLELRSTVNVLLARLRSHGLI